MATQTSINKIQEMYIAYYGRPADPLGLDYWSGRLEIDDGGVGAIADSFGASDEYTERFSGLSNDELITNLYQRLFNRDPDEAGLNFYRQNLESGEYTLARIAVEILNGVQEGSDDGASIDNKVAVANAFTLDIPNKIYDSSDFQAVENLLANVTNDSGTVDQADVAGFVERDDIFNDREVLVATEQKMLQLINDARSDEGLAALSFNDALLDAAWDHNAWMLINDELMHDPDDVAFNADNQNLAASGSSTTITDAELDGYIQRLFDNLWADDTSKAKILNAEFKGVGIAIDRGYFDFADGVPFSSVMATQNFSVGSSTQVNRDASGATLLGVAFEDQDGDGVYDIGEGLGGIEISIHAVDANGVTGEVAVASVTSSDAGGYQTALEAGIYDIFFTDNNGESHLVGNDVVIAQDNVKIDWII